MPCVLILYINDGTYSLKSALNEKLFDKLFTAILFTLRVFAEICWEEVTEEIFHIFYILLKFESWTYVE